MQLRLFKMSLEGKVAVANLALVGLALLAYRITCPRNDVELFCSSKEMLAFVHAMEVMIVIFSFPVGWSSLLQPGVSGPPITAPIFVPLNAYFWGYLVAAIVRRRQARSDAIVLRKLAGDDGAPKP